MTIDDINAEFKYPSLGIYNVNGPGWETNKKKICEELTTLNCIEA